MVTIIAYGLFLLFCLFCLIGGIRKLIAQDVARQYKGSEKVNIAISYFLVIVGLIGLMRNVDFVSKFGELYGPLLFIIAGGAIAFEIRLRRLEQAKKD